MDKQVVGQEIVDPDGVILVGDMGQVEDPEEWSDEKTRTEADLIKTRIRKTIEQDLIDDPYAQRVFSELLKEAIKDAEALFDFPGKQFTMFKDLEAQVAKKDTPGIPNRFADHPMAQAFYGAFLETRPQDGSEHTDEDSLVAEALYIEEAVDNAIRTFSINPGSIEAEIRRALLPRYFKFFGGLDAANALINQVITIVRAGTAKRRL